MSRHIHLATNDGLKWRQSFSLSLLVDAGAIVHKFFNAKHGAMVGDGHAFHIIGNGFIYKLRYFRLSIEDGIISMYVKVNEVVHICLFRFAKIR